MNPLVTLQVVVSTEGGLALLALEGPFLEGCGLPKVPMVLLRRMEHHVRLLVHLSRMSGHHRGLHIALWRPGRAKMRGHLQAILRLGAMWMPGRVRLGRRHLPIWSMSLSTWTLIADGWKRILWPGGKTEIRSRALSPHLGICARALSSRSQRQR